MRVSGFWASRAGLRTERTERTERTADRSIRSIDVALRRRFDIFDFAPSARILQKYYESRRNDVPDLIDGFNRLNDRLTELLDEYHTIGQTFFMARWLSCTAPTRRIFAGEGRRTVRLGAEGAEWTSR